MYDLPENNQSEQTSFVDADEQRRKEEEAKAKEEKARLKELVKNQQPPTGQNPLALLEKFDKLIELKEKELEEIKKNTAAINALTSTLVAQVRKDIPETRLPPQQVKEVPETPKKPTETNIAPPSTTEEQIPQKETPLPPPAPKSSIIENAKGCFGNKLADLLEFTDEETYIKIKPIKYLGSDNFAKIASVNRELGGEYISAGKDSHFRLPKSNISK